MVAPIMELWNGGERVKLVGARGWEGRRQTGGRAQEEKDNVGVESRWLSAWSWSSSFAVIAIVVVTVVAVLDIMVWGQSSFR